LHQHLDDRLRVLGRPLEFVHAASAAEAIALLARRDDVALVLLDVVMESEDAGLQAVERLARAAVGRPLQRP
jgi:CheY-like chemotaxis protein